ncbi:MAG: type II toxin-antitoxin system ParD family antitoxin [Chitinophagales bacterium]|nr:type II toxin-antitoxin system ParD family antitoxin [Chitinophagales bacterium]
MNVSFTKKQTEYIASKIASGDYQNASELVREALRLHEIYSERVLSDLKSAIDKGWDSPTSPRNIKQIIESRSK